MHVTHCVLIFNRYSGLHEIVYASWTLLMNFSNLLCNRPTMWTFSSKEDPERDEEDVDKLSISSLSYLYESRVSSKEKSSL